ncbi:MAG: Fic family protein [Firmicutes bacterium]|nr:Fic family protein [Bacillota bacterium]
MSNVLSSLDDRLERVDQQRQWSFEAIRPVYDALRARMTYASNMIEGQHLTLAETEAVLRKVPGQANLSRRHLETIDHSLAWDTMMRYSQSDEPISPELLQSLHAFVVRHTQPDEAGRYRTVPVATKGGTWVPSHPVTISRKIDQLFDELKKTAVHPVTASACLHARLMAIHPFMDGNGRTGRLLLNLLLIRYHYPPALLGPENRAAYYTALQSADGGDFVPVVNVVLQGMFQTLTWYEQTLRLHIQPKAAGRSSG